MLELVRQYANEKLEASGEAGRLGGGMPRSLRIWSSTPRRS
jgi:hypothetical protein